MDWQGGFLAYGVPNTLATSLGALFEKLLALVDARAADKSAAIRNIDEFFQSLPPGGQYFRLLLAFPHLLEQTIPPIISSPLMTHLLRQSPHIVDALIEHPAGLDHSMLEDGLNRIAQEGIHEVQLNGLRRFINEQLYARYNGFVNGTLDYHALTQELTWLAEKALQTGLDITAARMGLDKPPLAVLGLGKLGMSCMAPASDLDLIYIADKNCSIEIANEFSGRMQTLMAAQLREGVVYEMDMRLRPSGISGPPTVSLKSFRGYHRDYARTWEHLALVPARIVGGHQATGKSALQVRAKVLSAARDPQQLLNDAAKMYRMIQAQRNIENPEHLNTKLRSGGLLEAEYLANVAILQALAQSTVSAAKTLGFDALLSNLPANQSNAALQQAIEFWRPLQVWERLLGLSEVPLTDLPKQYKKQILASVSLRSMKTFKSEVERHSDAVLQFSEGLFKSSFADVDLDAWPDEVVTWQNQR